MTIWPFRHRPVIDADAAAWHADNFAWLIRHFGGRALKPHLAKLLKRALRDLSDQSAYVAQLDAALSNEAARPNAD